MAYIGDGHPLVFHSGQRRNTKVAWDGKRSFVRILTAAEYFVSDLPRLENLHICLKFYRNIFMKNILVEKTAIFLKSKKPIGVID